MDITFHRWLTMAYDGYPWASLPEKDVVDFSIWMSVGGTELTTAAPTDRMAHWVDGCVLQGMLQPGLVHEVTITLRGGGRGIRGKATLELPVGARRFDESRRATLDGDRSQWWLTTLDATPVDATKTAPSVRLSSPSLSGDVQPNQAPVLAALAMVERCMTVAIQAPAPHVEPAVARPDVDVVREIGQLGEHLDLNQQSILSGVHDALSALGDLTAQVSALASMARALEPPAGDPLQAIKDALSEVADDES